MAACCSVTMAVPRQEGRKMQWFRGGQPPCRDTDSRGSVWNAPQFPKRQLCWQFKSYSSFSGDIHCFLCIQPSKYYQRQYAQGCSLMNCLRLIQLKHISASQWNGVNGAFQTLCNSNCGLHLAIVTVTHTVHPQTPSHLLTGRKPGLWPSTRNSCY